ncbi:hypothetical protein EUTSA_v10027166mg [Eutrema salsugineum]|uniref:FLZ-type domain-containing protein n=1 Tax=Eutrema salsugineum TaxID=72664 RepID=V4MA42_EUTSA|nr:uncharacterized protein LOC18028995 [Eutrema salsugineum]ESQ53229.1 hypothetical protein EUTSA_v10027166mg [Eutrema salsugineum]
MLIGNRRKPQMQRTTSITRITVEVEDDQTAGQDSDMAMAMVDGGGNYNQRFSGMFSPGNNQSERKDDRKSSLSSSSSSTFLGNCGFCKRRLAPGRDIYMYKGDIAFCRVECREQQMEHDEGKTRNSVVLSPSN